MKFNRLFIPSFILSITALLACEEETPTIGTGIAQGEVEINIDTFYFEKSSYAKAVALENFDARTGNLLIGNIDAKEYGNLNCSFVSRLMCSPNLEIADSLLLPERVDSCKLIMGAVRNEIYGDSLAPQKLSVFLLDKQLPSDINNTFDPEGYYNPSEAIGIKSYTVSNIASTDSMFFEGSYVEIDVDLDKSFGEEIFDRYRNTPEIFQWPQTMAENFIPGLYVKQTFGKGCVANIYQMFVSVFYHSKELVTTVNDGDTITELKNVPYYTVPFTTAPEVLSSNKVSFVPSENVVATNSTDDGRCLITTPGGYIAKFDFPAQTIIDRYKEKNIHLSTVNDLYLYIPAETIETSYNISNAENLLLLKASEYPSFFNNNKLPDDKVAFTGTYDSVNERYVFTSLRSYIVELLGKDQLTPEDTEFVIVPVEITSETNNSYYGSSSTYVTKCVPLTYKPTMTLLNTAEAMVTFSFSTQLID